MSIHSSYEGIKLKLNDQYKDDTKKEDINIDSTYQVLCNKNIKSIYKNSKLKRKTSRRISHQFFA